MKRPANWSEAATKLYNDCIRTHIQLIDVMEKEHSIKDETIYHYTNLDAAIKIIEKKKLWASHFNYLNDEQEITHTYNLIEKAITDLGEGYLDPDYQKLLSTFKSDVFLCCFSSDGDDLSQWRGYGDDANGISIGFSADNLVQNNKPHQFDHLPSFKIKPPGYFLRKVNYDVGTTIEIIQHIISSYYMHWESAKRNGKMKEIFQGFLEYDMRKVAILSKTPHFSAEKEYRMVGTYDNVTFDNNEIDQYDFEQTELKVRASSKKLIPYHEIKFNSIKEIIIGPKLKSNYPLIKDSLHRLFKTLGIHQLPEIKLSEISYRD